jgi:hypothetical protein
MRRNVISIALTFFVVAQMGGCRRSVAPPTGKAARDSGVAVQEASPKPMDTAQTPPPIKVVTSVPIWQKIGGPGNEVRYTHTATFAVDENPSDMYMSIQDHMDTVMGSMRFRPFQGEGTVAPANCKDGNAPINVAAKGDNLVVVIDGYWESVGVRRTGSEIRLFFGKRRISPEKPNDLVAHGEVTIVAMVAKGVDKFSGRSADGRLVFHLEVDGNTIISTNPRGKWPCKFYLDPGFQPVL